MEGRRGRERRSGSRLAARNWWASGDWRGLKLPGGDLKEEGKSLRGGARVHSSGWGHYSRIDAPEVRRALEGGCNSRCIPVQSLDGDEGAAASRPFRGPHRIVADLPLPLTPPTSPAAAAAAVAAAPPAPRPTRRRPSGGHPFTSETSGKYKSVGWPQSHRVKSGRRFDTAPDTRPAQPRPPPLSWLYTLATSTSLS
jgi:hypothetical protein